MERTNRCQTQTKLVQNVASLAPKLLCTLKRLMILHTHNQTDYLNATMAVAHGAGGWGLLPTDL